MPKTEAEHLLDLKQDLLAVITKHKGCGSQHAQLALLLTAAQFDSIMGIPKASCLELYSQLRDLEDSNPVNREVATLLTSNYVN